MCDDCLLCQLNFFVDCPQVNALHNYTAQQPDELSLYEGDIINVLKKLPDGKLAYIFELGSLVESLVVSKSHTLFFIV